MQIIIFDGYAVVADRIHSVVETGRGEEGTAVEFTDLTALAGGGDVSGFVERISVLEAMLDNVRRERSELWRQHHVLWRDAQKWLAADVKADGTDGADPNQDQIAAEWASNRSEVSRPALRATHGTIDAGEAAFASRFSFAASDEELPGSLKSYEVHGGWYPHNSGLNASTLKVAYGVPEKLQPGFDEQYDPAAVSSAEKGASVTLRTADGSKIVFSGGAEPIAGLELGAAQYGYGIPDHVFDDSAEAHDAAATGTQIAPIAATTYAAQADSMDGDDVARLLKVAPAPQNERGGAMPEPVAAKRNDSRTPTGQDRVKAILQEDWPNDVPTADIVARIRKEVPSYPVALLTVKRLGTDAARWGNRRSSAYRASVCASGGGRKVEAGAGEKEPCPALRATSLDGGRASIGSTHLNGVGEEVRRSDNLVRTASMGRAEPSKPGVPAIGRAEPASIPFVVPPSASPGARKHGIRVLALSDEGMTDGEIANEINNSCGANDRVNTALVKSIRIEMERIARDGR